MTVAVDASRRRRDEVVDALAGQAARLRVGTRLPSEAQIMRQFDVSRSVARAAIEQLESCYLVRRVQGMGTYVHRRLDVPVGGDGLPSFHRVIAAAGARPRTVVVATLAERAPDAAAALLGPAVTCKVERLGFVDDDPTSALEHWLCPGALPEPAVALRAYESVHDCLDAAGVDAQCVLRRATTDSAPAWVCRRLELPARSEAWLTESACVESGTGRPLYYARVWSRMDRVRLMLDAAE
ncbi:GntR family transcriptional regulator [Tomitella fengzijianii]|uniref:GntR family transcriptional regulator n=1 Tax=Tomitella fengzijianii TaxID=2597660 RepID=A0A516WZG2_9ACTN|nr:GntR family transcriptional regulator [Tomitella fengzijianii]QDQ96228.1 GntR family transcriptional regulator [Tomitella fengzijianii]